jgi:hypothetical protein
MTGSTGPGRQAPTAAALALSSVLPSSPGEPVIPVKLARVRLFRLPGEVPERAVLDTVVPFTDADDARALTVGVTLTMVSERFGIELSLLDDRAQVIYLARDTVVAYTTDQPPVSQPILLRYAGPDTAVTRVVLAPGDTSLAIGDAIRLRAVAYLRDGKPTSARFGYVVRGTTAITVDQEGTLRALAPVAKGSAWVVVRLATGVADSVAIGALVPAATIDVSPAEGVVAVNGQIRLVTVARDSTGAELRGRAPTWTSSDESVATVSDGVVFGRSVGRVVITGRSERAFAKSIVNVVPSRVARVVPSVGTMTLLVGSTASVSAQALDVGGFSVPGRVALWSAMDSRIVVVAATGEPSTSPVSVRGVAVGTTTLEVSIEGMRATVGVIVKPRPAGRVTIVPDGLLMLVTETFRAFVAVRDSSGDFEPGRRATWRSLSPSIVSVDSDGTVKALSTGRAAVEAMVDGISDTMPVLVRRISKLAISQVSAIIDVRGEVLTFRLTALDQNGAVIDEQQADWSIVGSSTVVDPVGATTRVVLHGQIPSILIARVLDDEVRLTIQGEGALSSATDH